MRVLFLFIISFNLFAGEITCENGGCTPNVDNLGLSLGEGLSESYISIEGNDNDLIIKANEKTSPRNIKLHLNKNLGSNLNIDLSSSKENNDGADTMIFADHIGNLSLINNGKNGIDSLASSVLCAQKILNGDMGEDVKNNFLNLRANDSSIPEDRCVAKDFDYVKNTKYACQEGFPELSEPKITTTRWLKKKRCSGGAERKMCVEKKVRIKCKWLAAYVNGCGKTPPPNFSDVVWKYSSSLCKNGSSGFYADRPDVIKTEKWLKEQKARGYSDEVICNIATDRVGKLNAHYKSSMVSKIFEGSSVYYSKQEAVTYNPNNNKFYLNMYWGTWWGYTGNGRNVNPNGYIPPNFKLTKYLAHRSCYEGYSKYASHLKRYMLDFSCDNSFNSYSDYSSGAYSFFAGKPKNYSTKYALETASVQTVSYCDTRDPYCRRDSYSGESCPSNAVNCKCIKNCGLCFFGPCSKPEFTYELYNKYTPNHNIVSPGHWSTSSEPTATHYYDSDKHYKGGANYIRCYKNGFSLECRFARNIISSYTYYVHDGQITSCFKLENTFSLSGVKYLCGVNPYINYYNKSKFQNEASSESWQIKFEAMAPTGNVVEIFQKRGEGCY